jgi:hypothetical protein
MGQMKFLERLRNADHKPAVRTSLFVVGCILVLFSPIVGAIPGPGGVFVFAAGFGLMLRYSKWVKRRYVLFKRRWPKHGRWTDWGLRRASAKRRAEREARPVDPTGN